MFLQKILHMLPWKRRSREESLKEELQSHMEMAAQDAVEQGATPEEARFAGRRDLGSPSLIKEDAQSVWRFNWIDQISRDCRHSFRLLRRSPSFTLTAILSLALGVGSATAIYSVLDTVVLKPLAYREPQRLLALREFIAPLAGVYPSLPANYQHYRFWRENARAFESVAALQGGSVILSGGNPVKTGNATVSFNIFSVLDVKPQLGRAFLPEEETKGRNHVAIITDSLWSRRFGRSSETLGQPVLIDDVAYTIVGVLPPEFRFPVNDELGPLAGLSKQTEIFVPLTGGNSNDWGGDYDFSVVGRLRSNATMASATAELNVLEHQIDSEHHLSEGLRIVTSPLQDLMAASVRSPLYILMAAVLLLVLIVCSNLANLVFSRFSARERELSIRVALGAGKAGLLRQMLVETALLALAGGFLGLVAAGLALQILSSSATIPVPRLDEVRLDYRVFLFSLALSCACGLFCGLLPALRVVRSEARRLRNAAGHTLSGSRESLRVRQVLIAAQVSLCVVLLFGAGLLMTSLKHMLATDKGFDAEQALAVRIELPETRYRTGQQILSFWDRALDAIRAVPGVRSTAFASKLPLTGESMVNDVVLDGADRSALDPATKGSVMVNVRFVSPDYFASMGTPMVEGRVIEPSDRNRHVVVVSTRLAAKLWPNANPLGKQFSTGSALGKVEVIGTVKDIHATTLDREPTLIIYAPYSLRPLNSGSLIVRTSVYPASMLSTLRERVRAIDPSLAVPETVTLRQIVDASLYLRYAQVQMASAFGCAALGLALIGIYGVVAYQVTTRRSEVALRMALGGNRSDIFALLIRAGFRPVLAGLGVGLIVAFASARWLNSVLFEVKANDPITMATVVAILGATAFLACVIPSMRAARTDPAAVLRYE